MKLELLASRAVVGARPHSISSAESMLRLACDIFHRACQSVEQPDFLYPDCFCLVLRHLGDCFMVACVLALLSKSEDMDCGALPSGAGALEQSISALDSGLINFVSPVGGTWC